MKTKTGYVVWSNTDLNEGRGYEVPVHICECYSTAIRLSSKIGVQGSDGRITTVKLTLDDESNRWYGPVNIQQATAADLVAEKTRATRQAIIDKAHAAGLSDNDIDALVSAKINDFRK